MRIPQISPHLLEYKINPKAFINAHNFPNLDALVEEVRRIDNDKNAYDEMRNAPLFLDDFNPKTFYEKKVLDFFDNIFIQSPNLAFRRGRGQRMEWYRKLLPHPNNIDIIEKYRKYGDLTGDSLKIARAFSRMQKSTRKIRHKLKFWDKKS